MINGLCEMCTRYGTTCNGTENPVFTGCVNQLYTFLYPRYILVDGKIGTFHDTTECNEEDILLLRKPYPVYLFNDGKTVTVPMNFYIDHTAMAKDEKYRVCSNSLEEIRKWQKGEIKKSEKSSDKKFVLDCWDEMYSELEDEIESSNPEDTIYRRKLAERCKIAREVIENSSI